MAKNEKTQKTGRVAATIAELKQVSWPEFPAVLKKLGSVLTITGMFLLIFIGMDALLKWLYNALVTGVVGRWEPGVDGGRFTVLDSQGNVTGTMGVGEMLAAAIVAAALVTMAIVAIVIVKSRKKEDF